MPNHVFTVKANGIANVLYTDVAVAFPSTNKHMVIKAIWDTGATNCVITEKVIKTLGLTPTGKVLSNTANGTVLKNTYIIDIGLPNGVIIQSITATSADALSGGIEGLIGMDIINLGDLSITNHKGNTCMSFRIPSGHEIDYVKNPNYGITPVRFTPSKSSTYDRRDNKKKRK